ncbi:MAG: Clp protease N-terminal domain-containing protein [Candidatus Dormibacteria bacterium]
MPEQWTKRLTPEARSCLVLAEEEEVKPGLGFIGGEHLLLGLLRQGEGHAARMLGLVGLTTDGAREAIRAASVDAPRQMVAQVTWNGDLDVVLRVATDLASLRQVQWTDTEDLLLALWRLPTASRVCRVLEARGITADAVRESLGRSDAEDFRAGLSLRHQNPSQRSRRMFLTPPTAGNTDEKAPALTWSAQPPAWPTLPSANRTPRS